MVLSLYAPGCELWFYPRTFVWGLTVSRVLASFDIRRYDVLLTTT